MHYETKKIWGIDCILAPMQELNSLTIQISVKAGSEYETREEAGISHILEHMFFKGWKIRTTAKAVAGEMDKIGAEFNAGTGGSQTSYYIKCAPQFAEVALRLLADMMLNAQINPEELHKEKEVIVQELKMYQDNPMATVREKRALFFVWENSYGRPIIGYEDTIRAVSQRDLLSYKNSLYTKDNLLFTIAGKIENQLAVEGLIAELFSQLPPKKTRRKPDFQRELPEKKSDFFKKGTEQNHLILSMPGFSIDQEEKYAAKILTTILGGNMSSRLFQEIREELGLCYYISASHLSKKEYWIFMIRSGISKEKFSFWQQEINLLLDRFVKQGIDGEEFKNAKNYLKGSIQMGIESSDEMADFLASQWLAQQKILTLDQLLEKYEAINIAQVNELLPKLAESQRWSFHIE